jgi:hypothetical protein
LHAVPDIHVDDRHTVNDQEGGIITPGLKVAAAVRWSCDYSTPAHVEVIPAVEITNLIHECVIDRICNTEPLVPDFAIVGQL